MAEKLGRKNGKRASINRTERLKAALKANMAKRKSQARARAESEQRKE